MKTATRRTTETASVASSQATRLQSHEGLTAAKSKLNQLDSERAAVQAKLDQARAARNDANSIAAKILAGEAINPADAIDVEFETAKLKGYELAIAQQRAEVEKQLRAASKMICDREAPEHRRHVESLVASAESFFDTFNSMLEHVTALNRAGVLVDNRFVICSQGRLQTMVQGLKPIVGEFRTFLNQ